MQPITFVTSNAGKFADFKSELALVGLEAAQRTLPLTEPQEISITEIARHKAAQAYAIIRGPLIVEDSGLCIPALNDFPEALTKPIIERLGADGFLKLLEGVADRRCYFSGALAYADANGAISVITSQHEDGVIEREITGELSPRARSILWQIFRPTGWDKTMAAMDAEELERLFAQWRPNNIFARFARQLTGQQAA